MSKKTFYPNQNINDIIESENNAFYKGGVGSGKQGHTTAKKPAKSYEQSYSEIVSNLKNKLNGATREDSEYHRNNAKTQLRLLNREHSKDENHEPSEEK